MGLCPEVRAALPIGVYQQHPVTSHGPHASQVGRKGCLAGPALLGQQRDDHVVPRDDLLCVDAMTVCKITRCDVAHNRV